MTIAKYLRLSADDDMTNRRKAKLFFSASIVMVMTSA
jgi:hypothetical protein